MKDFLESLRVSGRMQSYRYYVHRRDLGAKLFKFAVKGCNATSIDERRVARVLIKIKEAVMNDPAFEQSSRHPTHYGRVGANFMPELERTCVELAQFVCELDEGKLKGPPLVSLKTPGPIPSTVSKAVNIATAPMPGKKDIEIVEQYQDPPAEVKSEKSPAELPPAPPAENPAPEVQPKVVKPVPVIKSAPPKSSVKPSDPSPGDAK